MTRQEVRLWVYLRELRKLGHHFRRQSPISSYIVDFECRRSKLIIEIDGGQHSFAKDARRDTARDQNLQSAGYRVLRFWNNQVDREFDGVMETILDALDEHPTRPEKSSVRATLP
jgi:very-short-patch-repair endonuclease